MHLHRINVCDEKKRAAHSTQVHAETNAVASAVNRNSSMQCIIYGHKHINTQTPNDTVKLSDKFKLLTVAIFATSSLIFEKKERKKLKKLTEVGELLCWCCWCSNFLGSIYAFDTNSNSNSNIDGNGIAAATCSNL